MCDVQERMEAERAALATAHGPLMPTRKFQTFLSRWVSLVRYRRVETPVERDTRELRSCSAPRTRPLGVRREAVVLMRLGHAAEDSKW